MSSTWSLLSLSELITSLGDPADGFDLDAALELLAETLDAEVAAVCGAGPVDAKLGFSANDADHKTLPTLLGHRKAAALIVALGLIAQYQLVWNRGLPILPKIILYLPIVVLLGLAPWRDRLDDSPVHRRAFQALALSPVYLYALGFCLTQLWYY